MKIIIVKVLVANSFWNRVFAAATQNGAYKSGYTENGKACIKDYNEETQALEEANEKSEKEKVMIWSLSVWIRKNILED